MSMQDPISDMLTRIRNAQMAKKLNVAMRVSKLKLAIAKVLKDEGYIKGFKIIAKTKSDIRIKVLFKEGAIVGLERVSKPGLRQYRSYTELPKVISGLGISIISTSQGVVSTREAKVKKIGGELLCNIW